MALINLIALLLSLRDLELLFNKSWDKVHRQTTQLQYGSNYLKGYGKLDTRNNMQKVCLASFLLSLEELIKNPETNDSHTLKEGQRRR